MEHSLNGPEAIAPAPLKSTLLSQAGVVHGVTHRTTAMPLAGDVSYVSGAADTSAVATNREGWSRLLGTAANRWVCAQQVHGVSYAVVSEAEAGRGTQSFEDAISDTDILISGTPGLALAVFCADCTPILLWDQVGRVAAAVHAGWRGTVQNGVGAAVTAMNREFSCQPENVLAFIGPSIGPCCYEVGTEVIDAWRSTGLDPSRQAIHRKGDSLQFDLWQANELALKSAGVLPENIEVAGICTMCHADGWFSHRASKGQAGRFAAVIAVRPAASDQA